MRADWVSPEDKGGFNVCGSGTDLFVTLSIEHNLWFSSMPTATVDLQIRPVRRCDFSSFPVS